MYRSSVTCMDAKDSSEKAIPGKGAKAFRLPRKGDTALKEHPSGGFYHPDIPNVSFRVSTAGKPLEGKETEPLSPQLQEVLLGFQSGFGSHSSTPSSSQQQPQLALGSSLSSQATISPTPAQASAPPSLTGMMSSKPRTRGSSSLGRQSK